MFKKQHPQNTLNNRDFAKSVELNCFQRTTIRGISYYKQKQWKLVNKSINNDVDSD